MIHRSTDPINRIGITEFNMENSKYQTPSM